MIEFDCDCVKKHHSAPVKHIEISENALTLTADILSEYRSIYLVADENTYNAAGRYVEGVLRSAGRLSHSFILKNPALPTEKNVGRVLIEAGLEHNPYDVNVFSQNPDFILGVGSGSINDICRMVSYRLGVEYGIVGTAPSMDGYASCVAPLIVDSRKVVYTCTIARYIIIDLNICAAAPARMLLAGIGDMIGKYVAILDWELSRMLTGEYFCGKIASMVLDATNQCIDHVPFLNVRKTDTVRTIVHGLILSGECIAFSGSSRPASGTEHMIGQTWESMDLEEGKMPELHGIEVAEGTFASIFMYLRLYEETHDTNIRALIAKYIPAFRHVLALQRAIRIPLAVTDRSRFIEGILRGKMFRVRYTLLEYLSKHGCLREYAEYAYDKVMAECAAK